MFHSFPTLQWKSKDKEEAVVCAKPWKFGSAFRFAMYVVGFLHLVCVKQLIIGRIAQYRLV